MITNSTIGAALAIVVLSVGLAWLSVACGGGTRAPAAGVTIEAISPTATIAPQIIGGKPETPVALPTSTPEIDQPESPTAVDTATPGSSDPTSGSEPSPAPGASATLPQAGRWIDVDVTSFVVRLMDGENVVQEISPVAVGEQIDTGAYASTQTGVFHVFSKVEGLAYDPPYNTYISHWVGFDPDKANGFHSFLKDKDGNVVDASTGRVSNGCIRTGAPDAIYAFAEIGMLVSVHG